MKYKDEGNDITFYQREDVIKQFIFNKQTQTRHTRRRKQSSKMSAQSGFSHLNEIKLNKGHLLTQQRNTEIQRNNRLLHEKLIRLANRNSQDVIKAREVKSVNASSLQLQKYRHKRRRIITDPSLEVDKSNIKIKSSGAKTHHKSKNKSITLFMGHSQIDETDFKIKIIISQGMYYLIAQNQFTKIVLQMPQQEYWALHYKQLQENPCNIFQYLKIQKGKINFRVKSESTPKNKIKSKSRRNQTQASQTNNHNDNKEEITKEEKVSKLPRISKL